MLLVTIYCVFFFSKKLWYYLIPLDWSIEIRLIYLLMVVTVPFDLFLFLFSAFVQWLGFVANAVPTFRSSSFVAVGVASLFGCVHFNSSSSL